MPSVAETKSYFEWVSYANRLTPCARMAWFETVLGPMTDRLSKGDLQTMLRRYLAQESARILNAQQSQ